jgi:hypothetical protein
MMQQTFPAAGDRRPGELIADSVLKEISEVYALSACDVGEYQTIRIFGIMKFHVSQYRAEKLGNISVMKTNTGPMKMVSVMLTPLLRDIPMMSLDYIYIFGRRKAYIEFIDLNRDEKGTAPSRKEWLADLASQFKNLKDLEYRHSWQDSVLAGTLLKTGTAADDGALFEMQKAAVGVLLKMSESVPELKPDQTGRRKEAVKGYYDRLISEGGMSTDVFRKSKGKEWTEKFFADVFFGTSY